MADQQGPPMVDPRDPPTLDFSKIPNELADRIARHFKSSRDVAVLREVSKVMEAKFTGATFHAIRFHDTPARVTHQLRLFATMVKREKEGNAGENRALLNNYMRQVQPYNVAKICILKPAERAAGIYGTWSEQLDVPREHLCVDPSMPSLIIQAVSIMTNLTHLELVIRELDPAALYEMAIKLRTAPAWTQVTSLRIHASVQLENTVLSRMVPKLEALHIRAFMEGYQERTNPNRVTADPWLDEGNALDAAEIRHPRLKRLHVMVNRHRHNPQDVLPPLHLFERLVRSFPNLEWLGVDVNKTIRYPGVVGQPDIFVGNKTSELITILKELTQLKRLAVTVHTEDLAPVYQGQRDRMQEAYKAITKQLASEIPGRAMVVVLAQCPYFYLSKYEGTEVKARCHMAVTRRGWPLTIRDEAADEKL